MFKNLGKDLVKAFNTGVSYFLPAVVIGGVFLAFALATGEAGSDGMKVTNGFMQNINTIGSAGMAMMIPMLADEIGMPEVDILKNLDIMFKKNLLPEYELTRNNKKLVKK